MEAEADAKDRPPKDEVNMHTLLALSQLTYKL